MYIIPESKNETGDYVYDNNQLDTLNTKSNYRVQLNGHWYVARIRDSSSNGNHTMWNILGLSEPFLTSQLECIDAEPIPMPGDHSLSDK